MKHSRDLSGSDYPIIMEFPKASATAIAKGKKVKIVAGLIVVGDQAADIPCGVLANDAVAGELVARVYCSPTALFKGTATECGVNMGVDTIGKVVTNVQIVTYNAVSGQVEVKLAKHQLGVTIA